MTAKMAADTVILQAGGLIAGQARVPGDKSISHRAIMLGSLCQGRSRISGFLNGEDSLNTVRAFSAMGVQIEQHTETSLTVHGVGMQGLQKPTSELYMGNAGTGMRLIAGLLAAQAFDSQVTGDESLTGRPMSRIIEPLVAMGAAIHGDDTGRPPLHIAAVKQLTGLDYRLPMASAQVKSCVLLAGLYADGTTHVTQSAITRDHTERMLQTFGYKLNFDETGASLQGGGTLQAADIDVPADISSAAFFMVAASIAAGSELVLTHVGVNPSRNGLVEILRLMGADIEIFNQTTVGAEPVADIRVRAATLHGIDVPEHLVPLAIDELPVLFVAAACASGITRVTGAAELRVKESDRIGAMAAGMAALGVDVKATEDGMVITGNPTAEVFGSGTVETFHDHRIAMAFAIAALRAKGEVSILDTRHVETSFPGFFELLQLLKGNGRG